VVILDLKSGGPIQALAGNAITSLISVINKGGGTLREITLAAESNSTDLAPFLDTAFIESMGSREIYNITLSMVAPSREGRYKVIIIATSRFPSISNSLDTFIDVLPKDYLNRTVVLNKIQFAEDLFKENPECLELAEVFSLANEFLDKGEHKKALDLIEQATAACRDLIAAKEQGFLGPKLKTNELVLLIVEVIAIMGLMAAMLTYYRRRIRSL